MHRYGKKILTQLLRHSIVFSAVMILLQTGHGAQEPSLPTGARPEVEEKRIQEEKIKPPRPQEPSVVVEKQKKPPPVEGEQTIFIDTILVEGNTLLPQKDIAQLVGSYEHKELTLTLLNELAGKITDIYREKGYITSFAYIPPQKIENKIITIKVIEGRIGQIKIEGARYFREELMRWQIRSKNGDILQYKDILWDLERMNENPDRQIQAVLAPSQEKERTDIILKVKEQFPVHLFYMTNNRGTVTTGQFRQGFTIVENNLFGLDDSAQASVYAGKHASSLYLSEEVPITNVGTKWGVFYSQGKVWPKKHLQDYDIIGNSKTYGTSLTQSFPRSPELETLLHAGFEYTSSDTKILGSRYSHDTYSVAKGGVTVRFMDPWGYNVLIEEVRVGIRDFLGADGKTNWSSARPGVGGSFVLTDVTFARTHFLPWKLTANFNIKGQLSDSRLAPSQQFYIGGADTVRGYPQSEVGADNGICVNGELVIPAFFFFEMRAPFAKKEKLKDQISLVAFYDYGIATLRAPIPSDNSYQELVSAGGGVRVKLSKDISGRIEIGVPTSQRPTDNRKYHVYFSVSTQLF